MATLVLALGVATCSDGPTSPTRRAGSGASRFARIDLQPTFSTAAQFASTHLAEFGINYDNVRIVIRGLPDTTVVVKDTTIQFSPTAPALTIDLTVPVQADYEPFRAGMAYRLGDAVVFSGSARVLSHPSNTPAPASTAIAVDYVGPGASVDHIVISPKTATVLSTQVVDFSVTAMDSSGHQIVAPPIAWTSSNTAIAQMTGGRMQPTGQRGSVSITALTPTGKSDVAAVQVTLPAASIAVVSGGEQTGVVGASLSSPLVVQVNAADGIGVPGVSVLFAAPIGGAVGTASAVTDSSGRASTTLRLGTVAGPQSFAVTAGTLAIAVAASAKAGAPSSIAAISGGGQTDTVRHTLRDPLVVHVTDQYGNAVAGATVNWSRAGTGTLGAASTPTDSSGNASVSYTLGAAAGSETISASVAGVSEPVSFIVNAVVSVATNIAIVSGNSQNGVVGQPLGSPFVVRAADEHGNPVGGVAVTWSASSGSIQASSTTDAQGLASATMTMGHGIGPATARASLSNGAAVAFTAIAFPGTPTTLTWKVEPSNVAAAAPITPALQVAIVDAFGNITNSGSPIVLTLAGGGSDVTLGGTTTKNATNGVATFSDLSVNRDGTYTLTASMQAIHASVSSASFTVTAGAPSRFSITAGDGQTATVNTIVPVAPAVRLLDASNNPVAGARITFAPGTGSGSVTPSDGVATTDANGVATLGSWKLGTTAGAQTLTVTGDGLQSLTLHATATAGAPAAQQWRVQPSNATANATIVPPMQVAIVDAFGNLTPATSAVTLALGGTTDAVLGGTLTRNAVAGVATFNDVTVNRAGTGVTLVATTAGLTTSAASSSFTVVAAAPANLTVSAGNNQSAVVGTAVATPPAVRLVDASGDPIVGATITFTPGSGSGSMSPSDGVVKTNAQGVAALTAWTLGTAAGSSNNTLVASAGGSISATFTASATPGALQHFAVEAAGGGPIQTQVAGAPFGIRVTAQDAYNNTVTNFAGTVDVTSNRPASAGLATSASFVAGVLASHSITLTQEGTNATITVTRSGGAESGTSNPFAVNSGSVSRFDVEAAGGGSVANQVAGTPFAIRITARDANGNVVTGFNGVVDVSSNRTGSAGLTTTAAFTAGVLASQSITLTQAGTGTTISVHSGPQIGASNTFIVSPAPLHQFLVEGQNGGAIGAQVAGAPFTVRLTAEDQFGNAVADFAGTADITSTGTITSGSGTTPPFTNGVATRSITIGNAGTFTITATHTGGSEAGTSAAFSVTAGVLHHFRVEAAGGGTLGAQTAGVPFALRVTAQDANNNTVTSFTGTVDVTSNRAVGATGLTTSSAFTAGVLTSHSVTLTEADDGTLQPATLTVTLTGGGPSVTTASFAVNPAALNHFRVEAAGGTPIGAQVAGAPFNIRVTARDVFENVVTGYAGTVNVASNGTIGTGGGATAAFSAGVLASHALTMTQARTGTTITVSDGTVAGTSGAFTVSPASVQHFVIGTVATQTAGASFTISITAQDQFNNVATGFTGTVNITSTGQLTAGGGASAAFAAGVLAAQSVTVGNTGSFTITAATSDGSASGTSNPFMVNPAALHHFAIDLPAGGAIGAQTAGTPFAIRITAEDANNNTVTSFTGTVDVRANLVGSAGLTTSAAFTNGVLASHGLTLTQAGTATISVTETGGTHTGTSNSFTVSSGTLTHFLVEAAGGGAITNQVAGTPFPIRVTAQDALSNTVTSFTGTVDLTSNRATGLPRSAAFTAGVLNNASVTLTQAGTAATITVTRTGGSETGTSNTFDVTTGAPTSLVSLSGVENQTATVATAVPTAPAVQLLDGNGNPIAGVSVTFSVFSGGGTVNSTGRTVRMPSANRRTTWRVMGDGSAPVGTTAVPTGTDGIARLAGWTLGTTAGAQKLVVTVGTLSDTVHATATADHTTSIVYRTQPPDSVIANVALPVQVYTEDQYHNPGIDPVTVSLSVNPGGDQLKGTLTRTPVAGVATFDNLTLNKPAVGYKLAATAQSLPALTTNAFDLVGPGSNDQVFLDMRTSLQQATNIDDAFQLFAPNSFPDHTPYRTDRNTSGWSFTTNADGNGLHALRADWAAAPDDPDQGIRIIHYLPSPQHELWVQFKNRVGGYPTDPDANGTPNDYPTFATGTADGLTACKRALFGDTTQVRRIDYVLNRSNPEFPRVEIGGDVGYLRFGDLTWNFDSEIGKAPFTTTIHIRKASSDAAADGVFELWIDNNLTLRQTDVPADGAGLTDWSFPTTCVNMPRPAAEYFWDILVWAPPG